MIKFLLKVFKPLYMPLVKKFGINLLKKLGVFLLLAGAVIAIIVVFNKFYKSLCEKVPFLGK